MSWRELIPQQVNAGHWVTAYTLNALRERDPESVVLPIVSLGTPADSLKALGELVLPPLYHEALDEELKRSIVKRIKTCFPVYDEDNFDRVRVVELPRNTPGVESGGNLLAFSVDTAVEEHGPHLPLGTDTIQSYAVLEKLSREFDALEIGVPVDYGQLTWGLPFGFSIDLTAELLTNYVSRFAAAMFQWKQPRAVYVVDVHGSAIHRQAIVDGLAISGIDHWSFRWLHEPLAEFASQRGDQHAGGVETCLVEHVNQDLIDRQWWPNRIEPLSEGQLTFQAAVDLSHDLPKFIEHVRRHQLNGIVGDIKNYHRLDPNVLFGRMLDVARRDVEALLLGRANQVPGADLW